ncbi:MAG: RdgB/HAM1 family non-canonical purine NTP pyrophosphatase [Clostridia bacterium]|nr:RdgB/HAM1 family non-canonical purine NTP pyrophosphatase [Clostridia bacterium]
MDMIIATHNKHKVEEFSRILKPLGVNILTADLTEAEENGTTFRENAFIKAKAACDETGLPCIADDSGLAVDFLNGEPGVYSARYAEEGKRKLTVLEKLKDVPDEERGAHFTSAIACVFPNGDVLEAEGHCFGRITRELRGSSGFGYDPIFLCTEEGCMNKTFGEASPEEKDAVSHRGKSLRDFVIKLEKYLQTKEG